MSRILQNLEVELTEELDEKLQWLAPGYSSYRILRQSVDARRKGLRQPKLIYSVEVFGANEKPATHDYPIEKTGTKTNHPVLIVGSGPAGLFAALRLVERGIKCILFERGSAAEKRMVGINYYWRYGKLDPDNNVCFGEGGAGLYSDGKLITRIKSPHIPYVMHRLVKFGAPEEIQYLANPHVGSDKIRRVIPKLREYLIQNGCEIRFDSRVTELIIGANNQIQGLKTIKGETFRSEHIILATGHSAEDMFEHLRGLGVQMDGKSFAVGLRIEHPQKAIDQIQFRDSAGHPKLGSANYRLADHDDKTGIGVYSFCMCPGGYVLSSGTNELGLVCNGMSNYKRNSPFANSAIVISIPHEKNFGQDAFGGMKFRANLEAGALSQVRAAGGTKQLPVQRVVDFLEARQGEALPTSSPSGVVPTRLDQLLGSALSQRLRQSLETFDSQMQGFISPLAQFHGVESRTSCPVRITRDDQTLQSMSHPGLYPCGEGAGYAGGITSAACDGIRVAEVIVQSLASQMMAR